MKIDRVKLDLSIVAGILVVVIVSIFLGFALVGGSLTSDIIKPPINLDYKKVQIDIAGTDLYLSEYNQIVSVAQDGCCCMDTEKGEIKVIDSDLPAVLPLCITQEILDNYYLTVAVTGGYEPLKYGSFIKLFQKGDKYDIDVVWTNTDPEIDTCVEYWTAHLVLPEGVDMIILDSNQWPDGATPVVEGSDTIPGKAVCIYYKSVWCGCCKEEQQFVYI